MWVAQQDPSLGTFLLSVLHRSSPIPACLQLANNIAGWSCKLLQLPLKDKSTPWLMLEQLYNIKQLPGSKESKDAVEMMLCTAADSFDGNFHDVLVSATDIGQQLCIWRWVAGLLCITANSSGRLLTMCW